MSFSNINAFQFVNIKHQTPKCLCLMKFRIKSHYEFVWYRFWASIWINVTFDSISVKKPNFVLQSILFHIFNWKNPKLNAARHNTKLLFRFLIRWKAYYVIIKLDRTTKSSEAVSKKCAARSHSGALNDENNGWHRRSSSHVWTDQ